MDDVDKNQIVSDFQYGWEAIMKVAPGQCIEEAHAVIEGYNLARNAASNKVVGDLNVGEQRRSQNFRSEDSVTVGFTDTRWSDEVDDEQKSEVSASTVSTPVMHRDQPQPRNRAATGNIPAPDSLAGPTVVIEPSEDNIIRYMQKLERHYSDHPVEKYDGVVCDVDVLKSVKEQTLLLHGYVESIFNHVHIDEQLELQYRDDFSGTQEKKLAFLNMLNKQFERAEFEEYKKSGWKQGMKTEKESSSHHSESAAATTKLKKHELPTIGDVDFEIQAFQDLIIPLDAAEEVINRTITDVDIKNNKCGFVRLQKVVQPKAILILKDLAAISNRCNTWLKMEGLTMNSKRTKALNTVVQDYRRRSSRWHKLDAMIFGVDQEYGFSNPIHDGLVGNPSKNMKIETYWNQEGGKPFQNPLSWARELEEKCLNHYPGQTEKITLALQYMSPTIAAIAKLQKCRTWQGLKDWFLREYLDEGAIANHWQSQIGKIKCSSEADIALYVTQILGVLREIKDSASLKAKLHHKLFSEDNVCAMIKRILTPLSLVTKKQLADKFATEVYAPMADAADERSEKVNMEEVLKKLEERLRQIKSKAKHLLEFKKPQTLFGTKTRSGENKFMQKLVQTVDDFDEDDEDGQREALKKFLEEGQSTTESNTTRKTEWEFKKPNCAITGSFNKTSKRLDYKIAAVQNRKFKPFKSQVLVNQESLKAAQSWENGFKLRCWVCTSGSGGAHEFASCEFALQATNKHRMEAARDPKQGPGLQCFTCLSGVCFMERCLEMGRVGKKGRVPPCPKNLSRVTCFQCYKDIQADEKRKGKVKPYHVTICNLDGHIRTDSKIIENLKREYGEGMNKLQIHAVSIFPFHGTEFDFEQYQNDAKVWRKKRDKLDSKYSKDGKEEDKDVLDDLYRPHEADCPGHNLPPLPQVSPSTYSDDKETVVFDTVSGEAGEFNEKKQRDSIVEESEGISVYFMQMFNLGKKRVMAFYDSGAQLSLIETKLARELRLKMVDRSGFYMVGAGNKMTVTEDGEYEMVLGKGRHGEIYRFRASGMPSLTGTMIQCDWRPIHPEVRRFGATFASARPGLSGDLQLKPDEVLPPSIGGAKVRLLIGLKIPSFTPKVMFILPSGVMVARAALYDVYGSNIVFGGVYNMYDRYYQKQYSKMLSIFECSQYMEYNAKCWDEYIKFRDSIYPDEIFMFQCQGDEEETAHVKKWSDIAAIETEEMIEDSPFIIAGSEEKRSVQLYRKQFMEDIIREDQEHVAQLFNLLPGELLVEKSEQKQPKNVKWSDEPTKATGIVMYGNFTIDTLMWDQTVVMTDGTDILYDNTNVASILAREANNAVEDCFYNGYGNGLINDEYIEDDDNREGIFFEEMKDRLQCLEHIVPDGEEQELIRRETGIFATGWEVDKESVGLRGTAAFKSTLPSGWIFHETEHTCEDCDCLSTETGDSTATEECTKNFNSRGIHKLKALIRKWEDEENTGTGVDYRCPSCQDCPECKKSGRTRARSIREDDEQAVIEASVNIDWKDGKCTVFLPWIKPPAELALKWGASSNFRQATAFINRMLRKSPADREALTKFWSELEARDVVKRLRDLPAEVQELISLAPVKHYYPWNYVKKLASASTPVRIVMDSRQSGLNEFLAKGHNTLNNLQLLIMLFRVSKHVGTYDIGKMYNMLHIDVSHLCYQLILWVDKMDPNNQPEVWVITRAIYGTISSGNQAEVAIRRGATALKDQYPEGAYTIINETYVDDGMPGRDDPDRLQQALHEVGVILGKIGFNLKCTVVSGQVELHPKASTDGKTVSIAGYKWTPRTDKIALADRECNFNPNVRGEKLPNKHAVHSGNDIDSEVFPKKLNRAQCLGKLAEMFDLLGIAMPITMEGKIRCREISYLGWTEYIPEEFHPIWLKLVQKIQDARNLEWDRCVLPKDSPCKKIDILEVHDGSQHGCASALYVRTQKTDSSYSTRLLFCRSSLCPTGQTIPRNELAAAHLGAVTIYIARQALKNREVQAYSFGDSAVVMCWISNPELRLKNWAMARVREIQRLTKDVKFYWVRGDHNIADLATKGQVSTEEIKNDTEWQKGSKWMNEELEAARKDEVIRTFEDIMVKLDAKDLKDLAQEQHPSLPDLAAGGRRDGNSELDMDLLQTTSPFLAELQFVQLIDLRDPLKSVPKSVRVGGNYGLYCFDIDTSIYPENAKLADSTGKFQEFTAVSTNFDPRLSRSQLPEEDRIFEFPEEYSLVAWGYTTEEIRMALMTYPPNFSLVLGGVNMSKLIVCDYVIDPIYWGFRKAYKCTTVWMNYTIELTHKTHQIPTEGHHLFHEMTPQRIKVRQKLQQKCYICKTYQANYDGANLAYLDSLTTTAKITSQETLNRIEGQEIWRPRSRLTEEELARVHTTERVRAKEGKVEEPTKKFNIRKSSYTESEVEIRDEVKIITWQYFMRKCSQEVSEALNNKDKKMFKFCQDKIWRYYGRLRERSSIEHRDIEMNRFFDFTEISYIQPVGLPNDPFVYALVMDLHWRVHPHKGTHSTNRLLSNIMHIIRGGILTRTIREDCLQCRRILKKTMQEEMGDVPMEKLLISPPFWAVQIDDCGPFMAYSRHNSRVTLKVHALILSCINTSAVSIWVLETQEAPSVLKAILRHSYRYGYPAVAYIDLGPGLVKAAEHNVLLSNHSSVLRLACGMKVVAKPPQAHAQRGKVERAVQTLKKFLDDRKLSLLKQSILDWETTFSFISNFLNNQPMARLSKNRSLTTDLNDIITPNRLLLGRNNQRAPVFVEEFKSGKKAYEDRILRNSEINRAWYELLLKTVPSLVWRPKWFENSKCPPKVDDYVLFQHKESVMGSEHTEWRIGLVTDITKSESSSTTIYHLAYKCCIKSDKKKPEDWVVATHNTTRILREIVLLMTEDELSAPPGSQLHMDRIGKKRSEKEEMVPSGENHCEESDA